MNYCPKREWRRVSGWRRISGQETPDLVDDRGAPLYQPVADGMQRLQIELRVGLDGNEAHVCRVTASAIASAPMKSFLLDLTKGLTNWARIRRTS